MPASMYGVRSSWSGLHYNLVTPYLCLGRFEDALAELEIASRLAPETPARDLLAELREGYGSGGERGFWKAMLERMRSRPTLWSSNSDVVDACAQLGRIDEAFALIDRLLAGGSPEVAQIPRDPLCDPLRSDPRWETVLERLGLR